MGSTPQRLGLSKSPLKRKMEVRESTFVTVGSRKSSRNTELDHKNTWAVLSYGPVTAVSAEKSPVHLILVTTLLVAL